VIGAGQVRDQLILLCTMVTDPAAAHARLAQLTTVEAGALSSVARAHGVEAWLAATVPDTMPWQAAREQRTRFLAARTRAVAELRAIGATLAAVGCEWVALKGQALAEDVYPRPHLRYGVDIDVLVDPALFRDAVDALVADGWRLLDANWPLFLQTLPGELRLRSPTGALLDLHWHLLSVRELRTSFRLPTRGLLARRRVLASGLPALDPADQLVHLGVHGALSGATRLSWLVDAGLAARSGVDLAVVSERARVARAGTALAIVLLRARAWLNTPAPSDLLARIGVGAGWRGACWLVDQISPLDARPDDPSLARAFARSARQSQAATIGEFARHGAAWLRSGARRDRTESPLHNPADARSPLHPVDDPMSREGYFAAVSAMA
jgi:hypothetical protein